MFDASPLPQPMFTFCQGDHSERCIQIYFIFFRENAFENVVCKISTAFSGLSALTKYD